MPRDLGEILGFRGADLAVGLGDVEQAFEHVLEDLRRVGKQRRDLARIGLEARGVALGEIEEALARSSPRPAAPGRTSGTPRPRRRVTSPSTRAILAPSAITPMVKAIWRRPGWSSGSAGAATAVPAVCRRAGRRHGPPSRPAAPRSARPGRGPRCLRRSFPRSSCLLATRPRSQDQGPDRHGDQQAECKTAIESLAGQRKQPLAQQAARQ